jgi:phage recombination protein Bet
MSTPQPASQDTALVPAEILDRKIEYVPFLAEQQISLTPRMVLRFMCKPTKSGKKASAEQAVHFCMLCQARGLNPWEGDAFLVGYDTQNGPEFSLITAHQAFLKRAEVHPEYDGMTSGVIVLRNNEVIEEEGDFYLDDDRLLGGWAKVFFKSRTTPIYKRLRLTTFDKGFGRWNTDKAGMIVKCAEADGLRSAFPNSLGGMYLEDEMPGKEGRVGEDFGGEGNGNSNLVAMPRRKSEAEVIDGEIVAPEARPAQAAVLEFNPLAESTNDYLEQKQASQITDFCAVVERDPDEAASEFFKMPDLKVDDISKEAAKKLIAYLKGRANITK